MGLNPLAGRRQTPLTGRFTRTTADLAFQALLARSFRRAGCVLRSSRLRPVCFSDSLGLDLRLQTNSKLAATNNSFQLATICFQRPKFCLCKPTICFQYFGSEIDSLPATRLNIISTFLWSSCSADCYSEKEIKDQLFSASLVDPSVCLSFACLC